MTAASGEITAIGEPIRDLVDELSMLPQINRIVLDQTGLKGYYDFALGGRGRFNPTRCNAGQAPGNAPVPGSSVTSISPRYRRSTWTKAGIAKGPGQRPTS